MAGECVGWFEIRLTGSGISHEMYGTIDVCGNEQFFLGRDPDLCRYAWCDDLAISRKHLRVHCILYEQDPVNSKIAPFVYATDNSSNGTYLKKSNAECVGSQGLGIVMDPNITFLLDAGDELRLSEAVTLVYHSIRSMKEVTLTPVQEREKQFFASKYLITGRLIGEGGFGKVLVGIHQDTQRQLACKVVRIDQLYDRPTLPKLRLPTGGRKERAHGAKKRWPTKVANCFREFDILQDLSHPNIVAIEKVFWSHNTIFIFQNLVTGGDLFSYLEFHGGHFDEHQAARVMFQLLKGVEYLHGQDIVHRDLKPDNILMTSLDDNARVVITDFGAARFLPTERLSSTAGTKKYQRMFSCVGTLDFAAPEIHRANRLVPANAGYSKSVDMWSIGTITATILSGEMLFAHRDDSTSHEVARAAIVARTALCDLSILDEKFHVCWSKVGDTAKDFIKSLLVLAEEERLTASSALTHPWFSSYGEDLDEYYSRLIADWRPSDKQNPLVERVSKPSLYQNSVAQKTGREASPANLTSSVYEIPRETSLRSGTKRSAHEAFTTISSKVAGVEHESARWIYVPTNFVDDGSTLTVRRHRAVYPHQHREPRRQDWKVYMHQTPPDYNGPSQEDEEWYIDDTDIQRRALIGTHQDPLEVHESQESGESVDVVSNDCLRQENFTHIRRQNSREAQGSVQVYDTPLADQVEFAQKTYDTHEFDSSDRQPDDLKEFQRHRNPAVEVESSVVCETPPEVLGRYSGSAAHGLPTHQESIQPDHMHRDTGTYQKRSRLAHH